MSVQDSRWRIERVDEPRPALVDFLESVEFGGAGLRYRRRRVADTLERLAPSEFFSIQDRGAVIGAYTLTSTRVSFAGETVDAVYRGLLAVAPTHRRQGIGRQLVKSALEHVQTASAGQAVMTFGQIESANEPSLRLLEDLGAVDIGGLESQLVYRQWPRSSPSLRRLDAGDSRAYADALDALNANSGLVMQSAARLPVFALIDGSRLRAAARIGTTVIDLGPGGPFARFVHRYGYARFRALGRRYNRRAFRYLTIHDPLVSAEPEAFGEFTEAILAHFDAHMALFTLDPRSEIAERLADAGLFGRFSRATRQRLRIMASGCNLDEGWDARAVSGAASGGPVY